MKLKKIITLLAINTSLFFATALPGFKPAIQDLPGQYVYYEDKTFERKSYTGFLMFDEKTYAARYFAPVDEKNKKPEIDVELFFTLDPKADHIELTGERIISGFTPEEAEFVNYLHDMLYELNAHRIKTPEASEKDSYRKNDFFPQFGGSVTIGYDQIIPLFNVKEIFQDEANPDFFIVTCGQITSSGDKAFENFKGIPSKYEDNRHSLPKTKKATKVQIKSTDNQTFSLDTAWDIAMENVWMLGDAALISCTLLPSAPKNFVKRQLLLSNGENYLNWKDFTITEENDAIKIEGIFYNPSSKNISRNFKLARPAEGGFKFFTLTVYNNLYWKNRKYFNEILASVK